jgi:hypothetical protein
MFRRMIEGLEPLRNNIADRFAASLRFELRCRHGESGLVHEIFAGVSVRTFGIGPSVVHGSKRPFTTYSGDNGSPCQELVLFPPELKRTLRMGKWTTAGSPARSAMVMNMHVDSAGDLSSSAHVPGYGEFKLKKRINCRSARETSPESAVRHRLSQV